MGRDPPQYYVFVAGLTLCSVLFFCTVCTRPGLSLRNHFLAHFIRGGAGREWHASHTNTESEESRQQAMATVGPQVFLHLSRFRAEFLKKETVPDKERIQVQRALIALYFGCVQLGWVSDSLAVAFIRACCCCVALAMCTG